MGIHTGDSITIAPAQTLTDKEFQIMRNASFKILREIGVDEKSNVQFAINPENGKMVVIEMNPGKQIFCFSIKSYWISNSSNCIKNSCWEEFR